MNSYDLIKKPVITEKSMKLVEKGKYTFEIDSKASKTDVKKAIEEIFKVTVINVNKINALPKLKRVGKYTGYLPASHRAIVTLKDGDKIDIYAK